MSSSPLRSSDASAALIRFRDVTPLAGMARLSGPEGRSDAMPTSALWRPLAPNLRVVKYPGGHYDVVYSDAGADVLAARLNACLGAAG